jgi:hypothetical protein
MNIANIPTGQIGPSGNICTKKTEKIKIQSGGAYRENNC